MGMHCAYGLCNSDSRYKHKEHMKGVSFMRIPQPYQNLQMCKRWVHACCRQGFTFNNVNQYSYICTKHFVGGEGPTKEHPHPIPFSEVMKLASTRRAQTDRKIQNRKVLSIDLSPENVQNVQIS